MLIFQHMKPHTFAWKTRKPKRTKKKQILEQENHQQTLGQRERERKRDMKRRKEHNQLKERKERCGVPVGLHQSRKKEEPKTDAKPLPDL